MMMATVVIPFYSLSMRRDAPTPAPKARSMRKPRKP